MGTFITCTSCLARTMNCQSTFQLYGIREHHARMEALEIDGQGTHEYEAGTLREIPFQTEMKGKNLHAETRGLVTVKAPAPRRCKILRS